MAIDGIVRRSAVLVPWFVLMMVSSGFGQITVQCRAMQLVVRWEMKTARKAVICACGKGARALGRLRQNTKTIVNQENQELTQCSLEASRL